MRKTKPTFVTEDGREYETEAEAKSHEVLSDAREKFNDARRALGILLAERQRTADKELFTFDAWEYWHITPGFCGTPDISQVRFLRYEFDFDERDDCFRIVSRDHRGSSYEYRIDSLYKSKRKAEEALVEVIERWIVERTEDARALRQRVFGETE